MPSYSLPFVLPRGEVEKRAPTIRLYGYGVRRDHNIYGYSEGSDHASCERMRTCARQFILHPKGDHSEVSARRVGDQPSRRLRRY